MTSSRPSSDAAAFKQHLDKAKHIVALTGAGISAESGVPTFRGSGGYWRRYQSQSLASPNAFRANPSLVWEFYHYRRELVLQKQPNKAHEALVQLEKVMESRGGKLTVITQNVDELHRRAGTQDLVELHGSLFRVRCTSCHKETSNYDSPICQSLNGRGAPDLEKDSDPISESELPRCKDCSGLLRPAVVWFGEGLDHAILARAEIEVGKCDVCLVVGTSSVVYPAAGFAPMAASRGAAVAEFNMEETGQTGKFMYHFQGPCGQTLPRVLGLE